jgi:hypothetical protein
VTSRPGQLFASDVQLPSLRVRAIVGIAFVLLPGLASAQIISHRGFGELDTYLFTQEAPNDGTQVVADFLVRYEVFVKPAAWIQFAGGLDLRANSHDQVENAWRVDFSDRGRRRPRLSVRRLSTTIVHGGFSLDLGKQFIRWGKTDIVNPTDRFAPRDFLNVFDNDFLAITAARGVATLGSDTLEAVWAPRFTPSRVPLVDQRWTPVPPEAVGIPIVDRGSMLPAGSQTGVRWSHVVRGLESSLSFFNGFNNLPNVTTGVREGPGVTGTAAAEIDVERVYPAIRSYGADAAVPLRWFTLKGEAAYFTARSPLTDEYLLYVVQVERQRGEWVFVGGYIGEIVTARRAVLTFAPDRGASRSIVGRASFTIDPNRSLAVESAVHYKGDGLYAKGEYSQARGAHWRATVTGTLLAGNADDFFGQYRRNSYVLLALRYSF